MRRLLLAFSLLLTGLAGCLSGSEDSDEATLRYDAQDGLFHFTVRPEGGGWVEGAWAPGALGFLEKGALPATIGLPATFLELEDSRFLAPGSTRPGDPETLEGLRNASDRTFLAPPTATVLVLLLDGELLTLDSREAEGYEPSTSQFVSGENVIALMEHQAAEFPHRTPGQLSYPASIDYFTGYLEDLGYQVEVDPYGSQGLPQPCFFNPVFRSEVCPSSLANVVATKPGDGGDGKVLLVGGHFDTVPGTTYGAMDNTGGAMSVVEMARVLAPYSFHHTLVFALWGGEENGSFGSHFWLAHHPEMRAALVTYWNLDVAGLAWPAPRGSPDTILFEAGPGVPNQVDPGPVSSSLFGWIRTLANDWVGMPEEAMRFQAAQPAELLTAGYSSDHEPFIAAGIPSIAPFYEGPSPIRYHSETDTLDNMTKYAWFGEELDLETTVWPDAATEVAGRQLLAQSFETFLWFALYHTVLVDAGLYAPLPALPLPQAPSALA